MNVEQENRRTDEAINNIMRGSSVRIGSFHMFSAALQDGMRLRKLHLEYIT
jgi:hypothetical protein